MGRLVDALLPPRLGRDFRWLWSGFVATNLADGVLMAVGPLLVASVTRQPFAIATAVFVQRLPWLLLGVVAGAVIDRQDRRRLLMIVNGLRAVVLLSLAATIATGTLNLTVIYIAMFLVGCAETFADNASTTLIAVAVPSSGLGVANSRLAGARIVSNELAGPPVGAFLFGLSAALPFGLNAVLFTLAVGMVARIELPAGDGSQRSSRRLRTEVTEGLVWLWDHAAVRTLMILITVFNITFGAAFSIWVLYALDRLGLDATGFGLLISATAAGGLVGSATFTWLEERVSYATMLRVGLVFESITHALLASTRSAIFAGAVMALFGIHAVVWGSISNTIRHRAVPRPLLGRVTSVMMVGSVGALSIGTLIGGALAQRYGVLAPFWFASAGATLTTAVVWRSITHVAHAGETVREPSDDATVSEPTR